ncbi:MAG: threonine/serine dehydratase [Pseudomonadota bacterium]
MSDFTEIKRAAERLDGVAVRTPLLEAPLLNATAGRRVLVKAEALQRTGSFKFRGAWNALSSFSAEERRRGVLAYSSGNHAQGIACAAQELGIPATIIMPDDAPQLKIANTKAYGADIVLYDRASGASREELGARLVEERGLRLVAPFDDPYVVAGQGTTGLEIAEQAAERGISEAEVLVCSGGGGLSAGCALALEATAPEMRVRTVEPVGFEDWQRSLAAGTVQPNNRPTGSICDAILTLSPGQLTWPIGERLFGPGLSVTDEEAIAAMRVAAERLKLVLEPGGAVALAAALFRSEEIEGDAVIVVASGGNVDVAQYADWIAAA